MLDKIKAALGITSAVFNDEITDNIAVALADMGYTSDISNLETTDSLIIKAVMTYCAFQHHLNHGSPDLAEQYKKSYEAQKAALITSSRYTTW